jgi:hypothetical protein
MMMVRMMMMMMMMMVRLLWWRFALTCVCADQPQTTLHQRTLSSLQHSCSRSSSFSFCQIPVCPSDQNFHCP